MRRLERLRLSYRGTSRIRNRPPLGPYSRTMLRALRWSWGRGGSYERVTPLDMLDEPLCHRHNTHDSLLCLKTLKVLNGARFGLTFEPFSGGVERLPASALPPCRPCSGPSSLSPSLLLSLSRPLLPSLTLSLSLSLSLALFRWGPSKVPLRDQIAASFYEKYSVGPSMRPICTRCCFAMTNMIHMCA